MDDLKELWCTLQSKDNLHRHYSRKSLFNMKISERLQLGLVLFLQSTSAFQFVWRIGGRPRFLDDRNDNDLISSDEDIFEDSLFLLLLLLMLLLLLFQDLYLQFRWFVFVRYNEDFILLFTKELMLQFEAKWFWICSLNDNNNYFFINSLLAAKQNMII